MNEIKVMEQRVMGASALRKRLFKETPLGRDLQGRTQRFVVCGESQGKSHPGRGGGKDRSWAFLKHRSKEGQGAWVWVNREGVVQTAQACG